MGEMRKDSAESRTAHNPGFFDENEIGHNDYSNHVYARKKRAQDLLQKGKILTLQKRSKRSFARFSFLLQDFSKAHTGQHIFFKLPKKAELTKQPSVSYQQYLVNRKNHQQSEEMIT